MDVGAIKLARRGCHSTLAEMVNALRPDQKTATLSITTGLVSSNSAHAPQLTR